MHPDSVPEQPLRAVMGRLESAQRVYFFEREDGSIIFAQAREAWNMISHPFKSIGSENRKPKFIGSSDGTIYRSAVIAAQKLFAEKGQAELKECQRILRDGEKAELAAARGNMVLPPNFDMIDNRGNPTIINSSKIRL